jgi:acyl-coenzyme A thioesterase PaaI-like protein
MNLKPYLLRFWNFWPPLLFSGIKIVKISPDFKYIKVRLKLRFWNANYVGTAFGGSIFAMTDAFYMVMLMKNLGPTYIVWDKAAEIRYVKPGKTDVLAEFVITDEEIENIKELLKEVDKMDWVKPVQVIDKEGQLIADVKRIIYIKKKTG